MSNPIQKSAPSSSSATSSSAKAQGKTQPPAVDIKASEVAQKSLSEEKMSPKSASLPAIQTQAMPKEGQVELEVPNHITRAEFINLFPPEFRSSGFLKKILDTVWEAAPDIFRENAKGTESKGHGFAFCINAEIFAGVIDWVRHLPHKPALLEIGAGYGLKSLLFSIARPDATVYINDLPDANLNACRKYVDKMGARKQNIKVIEQDCMELLQNPELAGLERGIDCLMAESMLQFLTEQEQQDFFRLAREVVRPGGKIVISLQASREDIPSIHFVQIAKLCSFEPNANGTLGKKILFQEKTAILPTDAPSLTKEEITNYQSKVLFSNENLRHPRWHGDTSTKIEEVFHNPEVIGRVQEKLNKLIEDSQMMENTYEVFTEKTYTCVTGSEGLADLAASHGFVNIKTYPIDNRGHIIDPSQIKKRGVQFFCIIAENPE
jgi:2-polyprenyl-3-methyl-5-hydroxy-6-metoxy-1,4-benzoquinol methylase